LVRLWLPLILHGRVAVGRLGEAVGLVPKLRAAFCAVSRQIYMASANLHSYVDSTANNIGI